MMLTLWMPQSFLSALLVKESWQEIAYKHSQQPEGFFLLLKNKKHFLRYLSVKFRSNAKSLHLIISAFPGI